MSIGFWEEQFNKWNADGIDFVPFFDAYNDNPTKIYCTYTRNEMMHPGCTYPRSGYRFWKMVNGKKVYINTNTNANTGTNIGSSFTKEKTCIAHKSPIYLVWDMYDFDEPMAIVKDRIVAEELCMSLYEEYAYELALSLYMKNHHWSMERACREAWRRIAGEFYIMEQNLLDYAFI